MKAVTDELVSKKRKAIGVAVRQRMAEAEMTIDELAERAGMSNQQVKFIRNGERKYTIDSLIRVRQVLGMVQV